MVEDDVSRRPRGDERAQPGRLGQQRVAVGRTQLDKRALTCTDSGWEIKMLGKLRPIL
jgi:hypothetical protein